MRPNEFAAPAPKARRPLPSQKLLRETFDYDACTGQLFWRKSRRGVRPGPAGSVARRPCGLAYRIVCVDRVHFPAHRLIWCFHFGQIDDGLEIDHRDGDGLNNRIDNLRAVTHQVNLQNRRLSRLNRTGVHGVGFYAPGNKWRARITVEGKLRHLGYFESFEDAVAARKAFEIANNYHENHGRTAVAVAA